MKTLFSLIFILFSTNLEAKSFYALSHQARQGDTIIVRIGSSFRPSMSCISFYGETEQYPQNENGEILIGIAADRQPGRYTLIRIECGQGIRLDFDTEEIEILRTDFQKTRLAAFTIKPSHRTDPQMKSIEKALSQSDIYTDLTKGNAYTDPLDTTRDVIDPFGYIYRNNPYLIHAGVDLRASIGTPVKATNSGKVVLTANKFRREGNMIIIYHGLGIFSIYMHLSKFEINEGDIVKRGQIIGLTGETGAGVREPHLHFSIRIRNSYVEPLNFIDTVNPYLKP